MIYNKKKKKKKKAFFLESNVDGRANRDSALVLIGKVVISHHQQNKSNFWPKRRQRCTEYDRPKEKCGFEDSTGWIMVSSGE